MQSAEYRNCIYEIFFSGDTNRDEIGIPKTAEGNISGGQKNKIVHMRDVRDVSVTEKRLKLDILVWRKRFWKAKALNEELNLSCAYEAYEKKNK